VFAVITHDFSAFNDELYYHKITILSIFYGGSDRKLKNAKILTKNSKNSIILWFDSKSQEDNMLVNFIKIYEKRLQATDEFKKLLGGKPSVEDITNTQDRERAREQRDLGEKLHNFFLIGKLLEENRVSEGMEKFSLKASPNIYTIGNLEPDMFLEPGQLIDCQLVLSHGTYSDEHALIGFYFAQHGVLAVQYGMRYRTVDLFAARDDNDDSGLYHLYKLLLRPVRIGMNELHIGGIAVRKPKTNANQIMLLADIKDRVRQFLRDNIKISDGFLVTEDARFQNIFGLARQDWWKVYSH
jgi:hypothetical protein